MSYQLADGWTSVNVRAPGARPGRAARRRRGAGRGARPARRPRRRTAIASRPRVEPIDAASMPTTTRAQLAEQGAVIAGFAERRAEIARQLQAAAADAGPDADRRRGAARRGDRAGRAPERARCAASSREFLAVPPECLILTMKANQKYFPLLDAAGRLTEPLPRRQQHPPGRPEPRHRGQRARRAAAAGRREVLLRPGPQARRWRRACRARQGRLPRQARHAGRARRARARDRAGDRRAARRRRAGRRRPTAPRCSPRPTC